MQVTNEMRVRIKELQLELLENWLRENKDNNNSTVKEFYKTFQDLYNELPDSIAHFKGIIELKKRMAGKANAPQVIGINGSDETIEQLIAKYETAELLQPNAAPLRKEFTEIYKKVMKEFS